MNEQIRKSDDATKERREFLKKAGRFGITAPMAALLLSVQSKKASAFVEYPHQYTDQL